jgi:hypothetical protein
MREVGLKSKRNGYENIDNIILRSEFYLIDVNHPERGNDRYEVKLLPF